MNEWLRDDHNNLYSLVKSGTLQPSVAKKFYLPFAVLSNAGKIAYQAYENAANQAAQEALNAATPSKYVYLTVRNILFC